MPFNLGLWETLLILLLVILVFGAKRLPEIGAGLAKGVRSFKQNIRDDEQLPEGDGQPPRREAHTSTSEGGDPKKLSE
jgi:sec-independent protein translocase protein TatA